MGGAATSFTDIEQQAAHRTAEAMKQCLKERQGKDFDLAYLGFELLAQQRLVSMMEVAKKHASQTLLPTLDQGLTGAQDRLHKARELMQQVLGSDKG